MESTNMDFGPFAGGLIDNAINLSEKAKKHFVGVEDIFCLLVNDRTSISCQILCQMGINPETACHEILRTGYFPGEIKNEKLWKGIPISPRLQKILKTAANMAGGTEFIDEKFFILALSKEGNSIPLRWLRKQKISTDALGGIIEKSIRQNVTPQLMEHPPEKKKPVEKETVDSSMYSPPDNSQKDEDTDEIDLSYLQRYSRNVFPRSGGEQQMPAVRTDEALKLISIFGKPGNKNPLLISNGEKTNSSVFESFWELLDSGEIPDSLKGCAIYSLDPEIFIDHIDEHSDPKKIIDEIIREASKYENIIFINNFHRLIRGVEPDKHGFTHSLRSAIFQGKIRCIGATTIDKYFMFIKDDESLFPCFETVFVEEKTPEETLNILMKIREKLERRFGVRIEDKALKYAVSLSEKFIPGFCLAENTLEILTIGCAGVESPTTKEGFSYESLGIKLYANESHFINALSNLTDFPFKKMMEKGEFYFSEMSKTLKEKVLGRDKAVDDIIDDIIQTLTDETEETKPMGVFLFIGPPGSGKTLMTEELARFIYGSPHKLIKFNMKRYKDKEFVDRLIYLSPDFDGTDEGELVEKIRMKPYCVALMENIEMAHPEILDILSVAFKTGRISIHRRKDLDCKGIIFILSSDGTNIPAELSPNFLTGIRRVIRFDDLNEEALGGIITNCIEKMKEKFHEDRIEVDVRSKVIDWIQEKAGAADEKARAVEDIVKESISNKISEGILKGEFIHGDSISVKVMAGKVMIIKQH